MFSQVSVNSGEGVPQEGNVLTHVCPSVCPQGGSGGGTYPTPARSTQGEGYPKVPTLRQGTYHPARSGWGEGYPKVPTHPTDMSCSMVYLCWVSRTQCDIPSVLQ